MNQDETKKAGTAVTPGRRQFMNAAALVGLGSLVACKEKAGAAGSASASAADHSATNATHLKPGELDTYYGLWSGGHTGDLRVLGLPSGREIHRIPCFVPDALVGWGITNE